MEPDFSKYTLRELNEIKEMLDKNKYPERYERLIAALATHKAAREEATSLESQKSEDELRELFKEYNKEDYQIWKSFRGVIVMFISFRIMQYLEWSMNQQIAGAAVVFWFTGSCF